MVRTCEALAFYGHTRASALESTSNIGRPLQDKNNAPKQALSIAGFHGDTVVVRHLNL